MCVCARATEGLLRCTTYTHCTSERVVLGGGGEAMLNVFHVLFFFFFLKYNVVELFGLQMCTGSLVNIV